MLVELLLLFKKGVFINIKTSWVRVEILLNRELALV